VSRVRLLEREEAPILARQWFREDGSASPLTRSLATAPDVMEALMPFLGQILGESSLDLATKELVILRVSQLNGCRYCIAAHLPLARAAGVPDAICDELPFDALPERERALVAWVDAVAHEAARVTDELVARTLDHLRDDQLVEVTLLVGATTMLNQYCTALAIPPPS
jgi:4-carboxymuconolactone decarboxylase